MSAQDFGHRQIEYLSNSIDLNRKDRAKPPARRGCSAYASESAILRILTVRCKRSQYIPIFQIHTRLGLSQGCQEGESQSPET